MVWYRVFYFKTLIGVEILLFLEKTIVHFDNKKKGTSVLCKGLIQGLQDTAIPSETVYSINYTRS